MKGVPDDHANYRGRGEGGDRYGFYIRILFVFGVHPIPLTLLLPFQLNFLRVNVLPSVARREKRFGKGSAGGTGGLETNQDEGDKFLPRQIYRGRGSRRRGIASGRKKNKRGPAGHPSVTSSRPERETLERRENVIAKWNESLRSKERLDAYTCVYRSC